MDVKQICLKYFCFLNNPFTRQSVDSVADHPITQDYLKAYQIIMDFKDSLIKVLTDKGKATIFLGRGWQREEEVFKKNS